MRMRQTGVMAQLDLQAIRDALASGRPEALIGMRECMWLDAKSAPYKLGDPKQAVELAKDVVALANARGGVLVIGLETAKQDGRDVIAGLRPVEAAKVNIEQHRMIVRARCIPHIRGLEVEWLKADDNTGYLVIYVPAQPESEKLFVVTSGQLADGIRVPVRDDDATHWFPAEGLQRFLSNGWNALDRGTILGLLRTASAPPPTISEPVPSATEPSVAVGYGEPGYRASFVGVYEALGGESVLGRPIDEVTEYGPGVAQHFEGGSSGPTVLCALHGGQAVAVDLEVWEAIAELGRGAIEGSAFAALGFPVPYESRPSVLTGELPAIRLEGGSWGPGVLIHSDIHALWRWEPRPSTDFNLYYASYWSTSAVTDLRLRVVGSLPWRLGQQLSVNTEGRARLLDALSMSELTGFLLALSLARGASLEMTPWELPTGDDTWQTNRSVQCRSSLFAQDGTSALMADVRLQVPDGRQATVLTFVDLHINFSTWAAALSAGSADAESRDLRVTIPELISFYVAAWPIATMTAPLGAVTDSLAMVPAGSPRVEFEFELNPSRAPTSGFRRLDDAIDLSLLGPPTSNVYRSQGGFGIVAPLDVQRVQRQRLVEEQIVELAQAWGFIYADVEAIRDSIHGS
jgi:Putative DNA-binding domain